MSYAIGIKAIRRLCEQQDSIQWFRAKLSSALFNADALPIFEWVDAHVRKHHALPQIETLTTMFPIVGDVPAPEPSSYYVGSLESAYFHKQISTATIDANNILKENQTDWEPAANKLREALNRITLQQYRTRVMDFGAEVKGLLMPAYQSINTAETVCSFGWRHMDDMGGAMAGDVVSFIGRPQAGKSFLTLYTTLHNWRKKKINVLFASMEMGHLPIAQRAAAMVAGTNIEQLKQGAYATPTLKLFMSSLQEITADDKAGGPKLYVVNGNLAADVEDIYQLADQLKCQAVVIDGAYLCRHKNPRLDRFTRAAENCELMKRYSEDLQMPTFSSWQFNRTAADKQKKNKGGSGDVGGLEDIGYSDAIGQISSIVLGLFQDDGVESMNKKKIRVLKGRSGEVGEFEINWDFSKMNFDQVAKEIQAEEAPELSDEFI